jgi:hypothetical protein
MADSWQELAAEAVAEIERLRTTLAAQQERYEALRKALEPLPPVPCCPRCGRPYDGADQLEGGKPNG